MPTTNNFDNLKSDINDFGNKIVELNRKLYFKDISITFDSIFN